MTQPLREQFIINRIESQLVLANRFFINNHGSEMSRSGNPDFVTIDRHGTFLGIEAKKAGEKPTVNQFRRAIEIIQSGGRYVVAYDGFDLDSVDERDGLETFCLPGLEIGAGEFDAHDSFRHPRGVGAIEVVARAV